MGLQETLKAVSDPTRREILKVLRDGNTKTAGEISDCFEMTGATVSHHLSVLTEAGLILKEKRGKFIFYEINTTILEDVLAFFSELRGEDKNEKDENGED